MGRSMVQRAAGETRGSPVTNLGRRRRHLLPVPECVKSGVGKLRPEA
jgi:hypothetical protein